MAIINSKDFLTTAEAAMALSLGTDTVKKYCQLKKLKAEKIGRDWLVYRSEIKRYNSERIPQGRPKIAE